MLKLADAHSPASAQSFVFACSIAGANRCSNATGSRAGGFDLEGASAATAPSVPSLPGFCSAISIQVASWLPTGIGTDGLRYTVANLASTSGNRSEEHTSELQ